MSENRITLRNAIADSLRHRHLTGDEWRPMAEYVLDLIDLKIAEHPVIAAAEAFRDAAVRQTPEGEECMTWDARTEQAASAVISAVDAYRKAREGRG